MNAASRSRKSLARADGSGNMVSSMLWRTGDVSRRVTPRAPGRWVKRALQPGDLRRRFAPKGRPRQARWPRPGDAGVAAEVRYTLGAEEVLVHERPARHLARRLTGQAQHAVHED